MSFAITFVLLFIFLLLSAFFSGVETAIVSVSKIRAQFLASTNVRGAKALYKLKQNPDRFLVTVLVGNNLVNIGSSAIATSIAISLYGSVGVGIATGVMTLIILVFCEISPKSYALKHSEYVSLHVSKLIVLLEIFMYPLGALLLKITGVLVNNGAMENKQKITEEYLKSFISMSAEQGAIKKDEKEFMHRVLNFDDFLVKDIMIQRMKVVGLDINTSKRALLEFIDTVNYSRIPVYEDSIDNIKGVLYVRDFLHYLRKKKSDFNLKKMLHKPIFVPETKKIGVLLKLFQKKQIHIALVVDEYGSISGIVTLEDILEELVGEIYDETDTELKKIRKLKGSTYIVDGDIYMEDLEVELGINCIDIVDPKYDTLGGFILHRLGRIPILNEKIDIPEFGFTAIIEAVDTMQILKVRLIKI
ncbi:MAG: hemolysin family protein [DPANN group archaeon]|nr:hemolysin family protein [DPANN group archaeon]